MLIECSHSQRSASSLYAPPAVFSETPNLPTLGQSFSEDGPALLKGTPWSFEFSGYARMPIRFADALSGIEGRTWSTTTTKSGFAYLRVNETEWVELVLSARRDNTRIVTGLFASDLSDWSDRAGQSSTPAFAFIEQTGPHPSSPSMPARMFWRRLGYGPV